MMRHHPRKLAHLSTEMNHDVGCSRCSVKNPAQTDWKGRFYVKSIMAVIWSTSVVILLVI
jgi:hypothetical protein